MAIISVRRVRDAFVKAEVTDEAKGIELASDLDEALSEKVVTKERLETLEERVDARFDMVDARFREMDARMEARFREQDARIEARFAQAEADAERRANRQTAMLIGAIAVAVGVIAILIVVL